MWLSRHGGSGSLGTEVARAFDFLVILSLFILKVSVSWMIEFLLPFFFCCEIFKNCQCIKDRRVFKMKICVSFILFKQNELWIRVINLHY